MRWLLLVTLAACAKPAPPVIPIANAAPPVVLAPTHLKPVDVDFKVRGYFYAGSPDDHGLGGHAKSDNAPQPLASLTGAPPTSRGLSLVAQPEVRKEFGKGSDGFRVLVINASGKPAEFSAQDSRLQMVHEAYDASTGKWAEIEYLPSSWCGNSYHVMALAADSYWELTAPRYRGKLATQLRIRLAATDTMGNASVIYSNQFAGSINPGQFKEKQGHTAQNIMDPYDD